MSQCFGGSNIIANTWNVEIHSKSRKGSSNLIVKGYPKLALESHSDTQRCIEPFSGVITVKSEIKTFERLHLMTQLTPIRPWICVIRPEIERFCSYLQDLSLFPFLWCIGCKYSVFGETNTQQLINVEHAVKFRFGCHLIDAFIRYKI